MNILTKQQATDKLLSVLPDDINTLSNIFHSNGLELFLVGGCVRDAFIGKQIKDFDVCTNAMPDSILTLLKANNVKCELRGEDFGVIVACMDEDIEIATFRTDIAGDTGNNKDTVVKLGATIEEDVERRDLTINALFFNLKTHEIIDLVGGIDDLINGVIRAVGNPVERFAEDNLRMLRVCRFASRFGFMVHADTLKAMIEFEGTLQVKQERIVNELQNAFNGSISEEFFMWIFQTSTMLSRVFHDFMINGPASIAVRLDNICSFNTMIASCITNDFDISKRLVQHKFSVDTANSVALLLQLENDFKNGTVNPVAINRKFNSCDLTEHELMFFFIKQQNEVKWLFNFKHEDGLSEKLMSDGIIGKDLGLKLNEIALERFKTLS